jgi:ribosome maturation factor RimP
VPRHHAVISRMNTIVQTLKDRIEPFLEENGFECVELKVIRSKATRTIQLFADKEGGISIGDCTMLARRLAALFEQDPDWSDYRLEVSSPGLDRPLKTGRDFSKNRDREVTVLVSDGEKNRTVEGVVLDADDSSVTLRNKTGDFRIPLGSIVQGRIRLKWS